MSVKFVAWTYDAYGHPLRSYEGATPQAALEAAYLHTVTHLRLWRQVDGEMRRVLSISTHDPIVRVDELVQLRAEVATLRDLVRRTEGMPGALSLQARLEAVLDELAGLEACEVRWLEMGGC